MGAARREVANEPPPAKGGFASRPMVARLVRYGPVRQKKTFLTTPLNAECCLNAVACPYTFIHAFRRGAGDARAGRRLRTPIPGRIDSLRIGSGSGSIIF